MLEIVTDGSGRSELAPGAGWAFVAFVGNRIVHLSSGRCEGDGLSAEIAAVIEAARWIGERIAIIWCDNFTVTEHVKGRSRQSGLHFDRLNASLHQKKIGLHALTKDQRSGHLKKFHDAAHRLANAARPKVKLSKRTEMVTRKLHDPYRRFKPRSIWGSTSRVLLSVPSPAVDLRLPCRPSFSGVIED